MKKIFDSAILAIASLFAAGCSDNIAETLAPEAAADRIKVEVRGSVPDDDTRTVLGDRDQNNTYPVLWQPAGEKLYIVENATSAFASDDEYEVCDDGRSAHFTFEMARSEESSFQYMAVSPYDAVLRFSGLLPEAVFVIPSEQTPTVSSVDPAGVILFSRSETFDVQPSTLDFHLSHITAYAKMTVKGIPADEKLLSVNISAASQSGPILLSGKYYYNYNTPSRSYSMSGAGYEEVRIDAVNIEPDAEGNCDVWFATIPTDDIYTLEVKICTDKTVYTDDYTLKPGFRFARGVVSRFSVSVHNAANNEISDEYKLVYTSTDGQIVTPANVSDFGDKLTVLSNTYAGGKGTIVFDGIVEKIGDLAFKNCTTLQSVEITDGVKSIGRSAFTNCTALESVVIPSSVTEIGYSAFSECSALTKVTIPESVTVINTYGFKYCKSLAEIHCKRAIKEETGKIDVTHLGWFALDDIAADAVIYVPAEGYETYISTEIWKNYATKYTIRPEEE